MTLPGKILAAWLMALTLLFSGEMSYAAKHKPRQGQHMSKKKKKHLAKKGKSQKHKRHIASAKKHGKKAKSKAKKKTRRHR